MLTGTFVSMAHENEQLGRLLRVKSRIASLPRPMQGAVLHTPRIASRRCFLFSLRIKRRGRASTRHWSGAGISDLEAFSTISSRAETAPGAPKG